jgi:hypothetical protein
MCAALVFVLAWVTPVGAQTMTLSTASGDYVITNVFSDVDFFTLDIEINAPLAPGAYVDPDIVSVTYQVSGVLEPGTPSGFPAFDLQRNMTGAEFYAQGSSLRFEIAQSAVLSDGVQAAELAGNAVVLTFNGREVDNGRFHPALLQLSADGTGRIQNSDNVPSLSPLVEVDFGEEYITDLRFDPGNTTLITGTPAADEPPAGGGGGGGAASPLDVGTLGLLGILAGRRRRRRHHQSAQASPVKRLCSLARQLTPSEQRLLLRHGPGRQRIEILHFRLRSERRVKFRCERRAVQVVRAVDHHVGHPAHAQMRG